MTKISFLALFGLLAFGFDYYMNLEDQTYEDFSHSTTVSKIIHRPVRTLDPFNLHFVEMYSIVHQVGEFLVRQDANKKIVPGLAKGWVISENRSSIEFHLRPGIYSAQEVKQSLERLVKKGQTSHSNFSSQIISIEITDPLVLRIVTFGDAGSLLSPLVMADAVVLPDSHWKTNQEGIEYVDWSLSKGPYKLIQGKLPLKYGDSLVFEANESHYLIDRGTPNWRILAISPEDFASESFFRVLNENKPAFANLRYSQKYQITKTKSPTGISTYDTHFNGLAYLLLNTKSKAFSDWKKRLEIQRRVYTSEIELLPGLSRAKEIPQLGFTGRLDDDSKKNFLASITSRNRVDLNETLNCSVPMGLGIDVDWHKEFLQSLGLNCRWTQSQVFPTSEAWQNGEIDLTILDVGMSDSDPVSSATFLFSPSASSGDADGTVMAALNKAKELPMREVHEALKNAYKIAYQQAVVLPVYYTKNRYYFTGDLRLNLDGSDDQFSEQIKVRKLRVAQQ